MVEKVDSPYGENLWITRDVVSNSEPLPFRMGQESDLEWALCVDVGERVKAEEKEMPERKDGLWRRSSIFFFQVTSHKSLAPKGRGDNG